MTLEEFRELKTGDTIKLRSGSPVLTVQQRQANVIYFMYWNEETKSFKYGNEDFGLFDKVDESK